MQSHFKNIFHFIILSIYLDEVITTDCISIDAILFFFCNVLILFQINWKITVRFKLKID